MRRGIGRYVVWVFVAVVAWNLIAPTQLGGQVSYVNIRGISMEPTLETGDLLVMRQQSAYSIGQVVAFRSDMGGAVVVHRIVATDGDRYLLKGDNNTFLDRYTPTADEILGAEVLMIPGGERIAQFAASTPVIVLQILMLTLAGFALYTSRLDMLEKRREARRRRATTGPLSPLPSDSPLHTPVGSSPS